MLLDKCQLHFVSIYLKIARETYTVLRGKSAHDLAKEYKKHFPTSSSRTPLLGKSSSLPDILEAVQVLYVITMRYIIDFCIIMIIIQYMCYRHRDQNLHHFLLYILITLLICIGGNYGSFGPCGYRYAIIFLFLVWNPVLMICKPV